MALHYADVMSSHRMLKPTRPPGQALSEMGREETPSAASLTGGDLIEAGYKPGPQFREMLTMAEDDTTGGPHQ